MDSPEVWVYSGLFGGGSSGDLASVLLAPHLVFGILS